LSEDVEKGDKLVFFIASEITQILIFDIYRKDFNAASSDPVLFLESDFVGCEEKIRGLELHDEFESERK
jgi:hypothetical protein